MAYTVCSLASSLTSYNLKSETTMFATYFDVSDSKGLGRYLSSGEEMKGMSIFHHQTVKEQTIFHLQ